MGGDGLGGEGCHLAVVGPAGKDAGLGHTHNLLGRPALARVGHGVPTAHPGPPARPDGLGTAARARNPLQERLLRPLEIPFDVQLFEVCRVKGEAAGEVNPLLPTVLQHGGPGNANIGDAVPACSHRVRHHHQCGAGYPGEGGGRRGRAAASAPPSWPAAALALTRTAATTETTAGLPLLVELNRTEMRAGKMIMNQTL